MNSQSLDEFLSLPVNQDETWQGGITKLPELLDIPADSVPSQIGLILWRGASSDRMHAKPVITSEGDNLIRFTDTLVEFSMAQDMPCRPAQIECNDQQITQELKTKFEGSGTVVHFRAKMKNWDTFINEMAGELQAMLGQESAGLGPTPDSSLEEAGFSDEQIGEFAIAAAEFYRSALWQFLDDVDLIKIETPKPPHSMKYATVLGAGGQSYGLGFYGDEEDHYALMAQKTDPRGMELFSCLYESIDDVNEKDAELWHELDLPLEDGDAFPDVHMFSPHGLRRPTVKEFETLTIVMKGLARTSEEEIDSGLWSKWVQVSGKRKKCVFSIPNLLDPPDVAEWIRRGKIPDQRSNELYLKQVQDFAKSVEGEMELDELNAAINARFAGQSIDDYDLPLDTPSQRAEASYQDALRCFGRRQVVLVQKALSEDPNHVGARILLAETTSSMDRRLDMFYRAKEAAAKELGSDMQDLAGEFWNFHETRPYMRACHGLATTYADMGQIDDAVELYHEMLELNPNDNQGIRYEIVPILLEQGSDDQAILVLDRYPEESTLWLYMKAVAEFRRAGRTSVAKRILRNAFKANDHVMRLLQYEEPPLMPETYALGSPEEAAVCIDYLDMIWESTEGYMEWMFHEYFLWERDRAKRLQNKNRKKAKKSKGKHRR